MAMRKWGCIAVGFLMFLMIQVLLQGGGAAVSDLPPAMFVLGDSSVDCGDNTPFYHLIHGNLSLFPCNGSDSTVPRLLASKMGLPNTTPFYSQNGSIDSILHGINFGSAAATILHTSKSQAHQSLNQQLRQAFETIQILRLQLGEEPARNFIKSSIFYLSFGVDDFIDYFLSNSSFRYTPQAFSHILVHQMTNAVRNLYDSDVKKIICAGVVPLGCTPSVHLEFGGSMDEHVRKGCVYEVNGPVLEYNMKLEESLVAVNAELDGIHVVFCDVYRALMEFINNHQAYGIRDVANPCCGRLDMSGRSNGCASPDMACFEASTHVWWDLYNPTPTINAMVADSAWLGQPLSSISRPIAVKELLSSPV